MSLMRVFLAATLLLFAGCRGGKTRVRERPYEQAIKDGVTFLISSQNPNGSWGTGRTSTGFDVLADVPGSHDAFRVGATALCSMALMAANEDEAAKRGLDYLAEYAGLRRRSSASAAIVG